ncbi:hypothetical protein [Humibacillus xanthopallidus]|uniref:Uncharacterized protein n=1 Tax=Humibacillus xanthopallidus TaxID=412689 RepID=A0A543HI04_9MICO|nr:hypothetical protein [Humibacillus xanthopallidus]TQM57965.1 hypothetical protein FBY41_3317 [Humibacillus xanthopallidus]
MRAVVVVRGVVDERDVWPYASCSESDGERTTLSVTVHDSQELVGVISTLTALGLEVVSTRLVQRTGTAQHPEDEQDEAISSSENDDPAHLSDDSEEL